MVSLDHLDHLVGKEIVVSMDWMAFLAELVKKETLDAMDRSE